MTIPFHIGSLTAPDLIAVAAYILLWVASGWIIENPPARFPSVTVIMKQYRREWMGEFVTRQPRIFDATLIDSLRQGTAFFASACMIAIGGGVALIGNSDRVEGLAADLTLSELTMGQAAPQIEMKIILVIAFLANALLKFIWAHRLFGYCSILMGAVPNNITDPNAAIRAGQAAEINITGARSFNRGLRSIYFALGALGWLFGPYGLILAGLASAAVLMRREFASHSRDVMLKR